MTELADYEARLFGSPQLDLFGEPPGLPEGPDPGLARLASRVPPHVHLGTSSWTFPGWAGLVYHRRYGSRAAFVRQSLAEYARHPLFRTVGIDRSYYAPIPEAELAAYAAQLPAGFRCCMKVWSEITTRVFPDHPRLGARAGRPNPAFLDPGIFTEQVAGPVGAAFADHLAAFVVEVPPAPGPPDPDGFARALDRFLAEAPADFSYVVELRDRRLLTDAYLGVLRAHGAGHVPSFWSRMPPIREQLDRIGSLPGEVIVTRLMLPPGERYAELKERYAPFDRIVRPQPEMREDVARLAELAADLEKDLYVIVNNKAEGSSPLTVKALAERLERARPSGKALAP